MKKFLPILVSSWELVVGSKDKIKRSTNHEPRTTNHLGFTLVELLVVVTIIAILAVIGLTVFSGVQKNARDARRRADVDAISKALEARYNSFTNQNCTCSAATYCAPTGPWFAADSIPTDPQTRAAYTGQPANCATTYNVCATLEGGGSYCRSQQQ